MNSLIEELYHSNLNPWYDRGANGVEKKALHNMMESKKRLFESLTNEQRALFLRYESACEELAQIREPEIFKTGFQFGIRLSFEGLQTEENQ